VEECDFDIARAKASGIPTIVSWGVSLREATYGDPILVRYAVCPVCNKDNHYLGQYRKLKDAQACRDGHKLLSEENQKLDLLLHRKEKKSESVFDQLTMLMAKQYALISNSPLIAEWFIQHCGIDAVVLNDLSDLWKAEGRAIRFLGKPSNYLGHPCLRDPEIRKELERQERIRDSEFATIKNDSVILMDKYDLEEMKPKTVLVRGSHGDLPAYVPQETVRSKTRSHPKRVKKPRLSE